MVGEQPLEGLEPVDESLGVVHAVHAEDDPQVAPLGVGAAVGQVLEPLERDADGKGPDADGAATWRNRQSPH